MAWVQEETFFLHTHDRRAVIGLNLIFFNSFVDSVVLEGSGFDNRGVVGI